jgi:hypothetical protein
VPVLQGRSREQIRVSIGRNLGAIFVSQATGNGSTTTLVDTTQSGSDDEHNGKWLVFTSGDNDGRVRRVDDYTGSSGAYAIRATSTPLASTVTNDTYELWDESYHPDRVHDGINDAILDITGRAFDPVEVTSLFFDSVTTRFDIPTGISMINRLEYRTISEKVLDEADSGWTAGASVTVSSDTELKKRGTGSTKIVMAAGVGAGGVVAYKDITSTDISDYTHLEFWARCSKTTTAADLKFLIDDTAASVSPIETLDFPVLTADTWTPVRIALENADALTAVISIGIEDDADIGAETLWIDDVRVVKGHTAQWWKLFPQHWRIDKEARDLVLTSTGRDLAGYSRMKMSGGDTPVLLTADATTTEVHAAYIIYRATALLMAAQAGGQDTDPDNNSGRSGAWMALANQQRRRFGILQDARIVQ